MITEKEKKKIVKVLGHRYVAPVKRALRELNMFNAKGEEHSNSMVTNVMNGVAHEDIETAIYEAVKKKKEELKARRALLR